MSQAIQRSVIHGSPAYLIRTLLAAGASGCLPFKRPNLEGFCGLLWFADAKENGGIDGFKAETFQLLDAAGQIHQQHIDRRGESF